MGMLAFALPQIQQRFHLSENEIGPVLGLLRLGFIPAVIITVLADFTGRKPFILFSNVLLIAFSIASAMAPGISYFVAFQFLGFMFISAETSVAVVMIVEEAGEMQRGFAVSLLSGLSSIGTALAAIVYGLNAWLHLPFQYIYYYGIPPLLVVLFLRTRIKETATFKRVHYSSASHGLKRKFSEWRQLLRARSDLLFIVCLTVLFYDACVTPSYIMASKFLQQQHHFSPYGVTTLIISSGFFATVGTIGICYLSDKVGRKKILLVSMALTSVAVIAFYHVQGYSLYAAWFLFIIVSASSASLLTTVGTELFPTVTRASATGIRGMFSAIGGAAGLILEGQLQKKMGGDAASLSLLTIFILLSLVLVFFRLPETAGRQLDEGTIPAESSLLP
jgi:AAHS family 4-hydroxybenzoate transporter-like MFS transporter